MGEYTVVEFELPEGVPIQNVMKEINSMWDAWEISPIEGKCYSIEIVELCLYESMDILKHLMETFGIVFKVKHGIMWIHRGETEEQDWL